MSDTDILIDGKRDDSQARKHLPVYKIVGINIGRKSGYFYSGFKHTKYLTDRIKPVPPYMSYMFLKRKLVRLIFLDVAN